MLKRPFIFISNDDGIHSPGLRAAVETAAELGDVLVVAPSHQQTSMGRSFRGDREECLHPLDFPVNGHHIRAYHSNGSPALMVEHGLHTLCLDHKPDLLISGINYGENIGTNVTLSGTVGAALQGASMGIPSIAMSFETDSAYHYTYGEVDWSVACYFLRIFAEKMLSRELPPDVDVLKVDVPAEATRETPWRVTHVARHPYYTSYFDTPSPQSKIGDIKYRVNLEEGPVEKQSDVHAFAVDQVVSVTPISLDLTSRVDLSKFDELLGSH